MLSFAYYPILLPENILYLKGWFIPYLIFTYVNILYHLEPVWGHYNVIHEICTQDHHWNKGNGLFIGKMVLLPDLNLKPGFIDISKKVTPILFRHTTVLLYHLLSRAKYKRLLSILLFLTVIFKLFFFFLSDSFSGVYILL